MATDPFLRDAVKALKQKIKDSAGSATPEELAYLGTAIDRIGGRATVLEVEEIGDVKIDEITQHTQTKISEITTASNELKAEASLLTSTATNTVTQASTQIASIKNEAISDMNDAANASIAGVNQAVSNLTSVAASANQQALTGSMFNLMLVASL